MYRPEAPTRPRPSDLPAGYQPRVVVKFRDSDPSPALVASLAATGTPSTPPPQQADALRHRFPGATVERLFASTTPARLQSLVREARRAESASARRVPDLQSFYTMRLAPGSRPDEAIGAAANIPGVERAYLQGAPTPPPLHPDDDPRAANQGYLAAAPRGIDARFAWTVRGGDGQGVNFVDLEQGWTLNHEDLSAAGITLVSGVNSAYFGHGTAVLGEILAQDNTRGCIGITPMARARVVSQKRSATNYSTSDAIISAVVNMRAGDILLLEAQTTLGGSTFLPVEVDIDVWAAIFIATVFGITVIEAGGNGGNDLDAFRHPTDGFIFKPGHADYRDSGAIMVGAATSAAPHDRMSFSNYGARVNCYAWGQNIDTTGDGWTGNLTTTYTPSFSGTSGASPIVTGAAISVQGMVKAKTGHPWTPAKMRAVLSNPSTNTRSHNPATDRIGVMPDLRAIVAAESLAPPVGDFPMPRGDTRIAALVDAGHGGVEEEEPAYAGVYGSPYGGASVEKDINLGIARRVRAHLGAGAALTRDGDYGVPLGARARQAREAAAPVFVSIHANTGRADRPGPEVWVYGGPEGAADPASRRLAQRISGELARVDGAPVPVRAGDLALLRPGVQGAGTAACLVEAGSLAHPAGAARLHDAGAQDAIGAAVARGVSGYLGESGHW
ncbi:N-acetylmuramoyl-L-alanine amidase [Longimicrobium sp.]|uniref:N-acetylmuramoyl-L-alanine amidase n=1 Tax=Longimicrobium sp. TaxID=2029185 RepID=UPI002CC7FB9A|nr:N-acetylmuramoyl-L-alanine amidase [Longimicrobium sp.]HSU16644.1 N-acetylmuramoyl-L-alanine amidase [Longimicrobium sp.]